MWAIVGSASLMRERSQARSNGTTWVGWVVLRTIAFWNPRFTGTPIVSNHLVSAQSSLVCTTDIRQTNTDKPISEDRLVALVNRPEVNYTIKIAMRIKGGAMPKLECGRRRRPGAEVQA
jgi:hypothetical protein